VELQALIKLLTLINVLWHKKVHNHKLFGNTIELVVRFFKLPDYQF